MDYYQSTRTSVDMGTHDGDGPEEICSECGAVSHGNFFCNTCRTVNNERFGWTLPQWNYPAEKPCGVEDIQLFIEKIRVARGGDILPSPYFLTNHGFVNLPELTKQIQGKLIDNLCDCGYILPSKWALNLTDHTEICQYRLVMTRIFQHQFTHLLQQVIDLERQLAWERMTAMERKDHWEENPYRERNHV